MMGVASVLGAALLCPIHGAIVEKTLFENGDGANTFRAWITVLLHAHRIVPGGDCIQVATAPSSSFHVR